LLKANQKSTLNIFPILSLYFSLKAGAFINESFLDATIWNSSLSLIISSIVIRLSSSLSIGAPRNKKT
jgi:hypothetical protein